MNFGDILEQGLFALGQVLRLPVFIILWICVAMTIFYSGSYLVEAVRRRRERANFDLKRWLQDGTVLDTSAERRAELPGTLGRMLASIQELDSSQALHHGGLENVVAEYEEKLRHWLDGPRALVKIGPSLGLIGTLIPMGTSLAAMAAGNLNAMAGQMVVAFTSTIIGLATGTVAYGLVALRQSWVSASIREQRYLAEVVAAEMEKR
ncbi:biopolymer transport protein ExbB/TolQ [Altererythrobacter atlanticus]|uniref:MotA/TolQ/ExbB proton channel family protein n=1 Tax=Croceibacterium atlanticum TaxID=1267766 RepID=A0A0F7KUN6_9SPHN|nr:MotA/TolQ/ExbB proton channel family protein [Croceibacterium atlanticum]AKH42871.1 MotA/TolQ/ExbB proton channel family protein [Croceibacterium atlanticum]MBB5731651.1 biopolymer transport protein ExbB/TolQ [Croceibacterium atlanticum]